MREQVARVVVDRADAAGLEDLREGALHHVAVLEHVGDAGRAAQVVLEHVDLAVAVAHQVGAGDVAPDALRRVQPDALRPEGRRGVDDLGGNDPVLDDLLLVIDVVDERVQRVDALLQPALDPCPLRGAHDARDEVEREDRSVPAESP